MDALSFAELWDRLLRNDESVEIEVKTSEEAGRSILETICAFANEPGQGDRYLLLGVSRGSAGYEVVGVPDPEKLQADLAGRCRDAFSTPIRPHMRVEQHDGKTVVIVRIPEARSYEKPVYIKSKGLPDGAFRRIDSTDQRCTEEDVALFYQMRAQRPFDETPLEDTAAEDVDPQAILEYRRARAEMSSNASELHYGDDELLRAVGATAEIQGRTCLTVAGLVLFGKPGALRRLFPMHRVDYTRVAGRDWVPDPGQRYQGVEWLQPLMLVASEVIREIVDDIPRSFSLPQGEIFRKEVPVVPSRVIREAVVNALMHRNYRTAQPVQIIRYANRIEIRNPGASLVPVEQLGEPGSQSRNPRISAVLHDVGLAETKGTGIRTMREEMKRANLTVPLFDSDSGSDRFTVILLVHHLFGPEDIEWLSSFKDCNLADDEARALVVVRETGAINNAMYRDVTYVDTLTASRRLQRLRDLGLLDRKGKGPATYYVPGKRFIASGAATFPTGSGGSNGGLREGLDPLHSGLCEGLGASHKDLREGFPELPPDLFEAVVRLGRRSTPEEVRPLILQLCEWRPLQPTLLAAILGRNRTHVVNRYLRPMLQEGLLEYTYPDNPAHPLQAYRTRRKSGEGPQGQ